MKKEIFQGFNGSGESLILFTLENEQGCRVILMNFGGIITSFQVPLPDGSFRDIVLGFDDPLRYAGEHPYFGAVVGRYANRIAGGTFEIDGKTYTLARNNDGNHLHGGIKGLDKVLWKASAESSAAGDKVILNHLSPDGDEGYPGNLEITVSFLLTHENELVIEYHAVSDKPTFVNLTHHDYFNLGDHTAPVYDHEVRIRAAHYLDVDEHLIPTGRLNPVEDSPMDFRSWKKIGKDIERITPGYDHCFVLENPGAPTPQVEVRNHLNGLMLEMYTTEPGMQFYTGNFLDGTLCGKDGVCYGKHSAFCLEAQHFPDSPHHPSFPETLLMPGQEYRQKTVYKVSTQN